MSKHSRRENRQFRKTHPRGRSKARRVANAANAQYVSPHAAGFVPTSPDAVEFMRQIILRAGHQPQLPTLIGMEEIVENKA